MGGEQRARCRDGLTAALHPIREPVQPLHHVAAGVLDIAYHESGPADGAAVFLMHGFPFDIHAYAEVAPILAAAGCRVIVPSLRGFGGTRFLRATTPRSGEQAALGADLLALMDALAIPRAVLAGYDWGGRAACVVAALWPQRCAGLVSFNSYNIQDIARGMVPDTPANEHRLWYQYYFHSERGRAGLASDRRAFTRLLWQLWSPTWRFDDAVFERSAAAFDNPDFVEVVIQSYRHRFGLVPGGHLPPLRRTHTASPARARIAWCPESATTCRRKCRACSQRQCSSWCPCSKGEHHGRAPAG
jgi:pimeloyl-ACP methyl ester carboxylesterase